MESVKAKLIEEDGCQIRVVHLERVEQAREDAISSLFSIALRPTAFAPSLVLEY